MFSHIVPTSTWLLTTGITALLAFAAGAFAFWELQSRHIRKQQILKVMKEHLQKLREQVPGYSGWAEHICKSVKEGDLIFEDLGTSEAEVAELGRRLDYKQRSLCGLECLRAGYSDYEDGMKSLLKNLEEAGLTLEAIGSSQKEFEGFPRLSVSSNIYHYLGRIRSEYPIVKNAIEWIHALEKKGVVALSEFDLSETEKRLLAH